jgi:hypothetical protein
VIDDFFALVKSGQKSLTDYLRFVENYCREENRYLLLTNLAKNLGQIYQANPAQRERISLFGLPIFERSLDHMGWVPPGDEPLVSTELRETLLWGAYCLGSSRVVDFVFPAYQRFLNEEPIHRDTIGTVVKIGASIHPDTWAYLWSLAVEPNRAEAERIMVLEALGHHPHQDILLALLEKNLEEIPHSLQAYLIQACAQSQQGPIFMWEWFCNTLPELENRPLAVLERLIVAIIPLSGLGRGVEVTQVLDGFVVRHPNAIDSVRMALELLEVNQRLHNSKL